MKRVSIAAAAAAAAVVSLAACSNSAAPARELANHRPARGVPVNCKQLYQTWSHGNGNGLTAAVSAVSLAGATRDARRLHLALQEARPAVARATRYPMPSCADPRGYWDVLLMHVNAAAARGTPPSSVRAAMKGVSTIERELAAELRHTVQMK